MEKDLFNFRDTFNLISSIGLLGFIAIIGSKIIEIILVNKIGFGYWFYLTFFSIILLLTDIGLMIIYSYHIDKILWAKKIKSLC